MRKSIPVSCLSLRYEAMQWTASRPMAERTEKKKEAFACLHLKVTASTYQHIYNKDPLTSYVFSLYKNWSLIGS